MVASGIDEAVLASYGTAVLYDAARRLSLDIGLASVVPMTRNRSLVAPAFTVAFLPASREARPKRNLYDVMASAPKGSALVVQVGEERWICGANMTRFAELAGLRGMVMDGSVRDIASVRERDFPIYARGVSVGGYAPMLYLDSAGEGVVCGGVAVATGDIVVSDEDGVVILPAACLDDILFEASDIAMLDAKLGADIEAGRPLDELHATRVRWAVRRSRGDRA